MITVIAYKDGQPVRHEQCSGLFEADTIADELKECTHLYDRVEIVTTGDHNGA
jgi:hypothetical protein